MDAKKKILVIDDEASIRSMLCELFSADGFSVDVAADGDAGLTLFRSRSHDLVITNLYMPGKEGIETIGELRELAPSVPIIAISGGDSSGYQRILDLAVELGASRALRKPFRVDAVRAMVDELLDPTSAGAGS